MGISLAGAVGSLLNNYEAGKEKQAAIQRQTQQQTLQNAIEQQRLDLAKTQQEATLGEAQANLMQQGWTPQQPTLNAAPPIQTGMSGGINPVAPPPSSAPDPNAMTVNIGGKVLYLPGASSKPAQRTAQIQALIQTFKSRYGQDLDPALAAYYHDTPAALDTAVKAMETANKPDKPESETWTKDNVLLNGKPAVIKFSNRGNAQTLDGKPIDPATIKPYVAPQTGDPGSWTVTTLTRNGHVLEHNSKTNEFREVLDAEAKDQDNPQQLMQGGRGVQGARTMLVVSPKMTAFEKMAAKDPNKFTGLDQFMNQFAADFNAGKITNVLAAERAITQSSLNQSNPELAMYLRNGLYYAFGENELQQRPSDFRTKMSDYLATISPNMNPEQIGQVGEMRDELMRPSIETAERIRKRMKMAPDPLFDKYLGRGTAAPTGGPKPTFEEWQAQQGKKPE